MMTFGLPFLTSWGWTPGSTMFTNSSTTALCMSFLLLAPATSSSSAARVLMAFLSWPTTLTLTSASNKAAAMSFNILSKTSSEITVTDCIFCNAAVSLPPSSWRTMVARCC